MKITEPPIVFKRCIKCERHLPLADYHRDCTKPDGHRNACKVCQIAAVAGYQKAYAPAIKQSRRRYRAANPDKCAAAHQRRMLNNPDYFKNYYALNRERELARKRDAAKASKEQAQ